MEQYDVTFTLNTGAKFTVTCDGDWEFVKKAIDDVMTSEETVVLPEFTRENESQARFMFLPEDISLIKIEPKVTPSYTVTGTNQTH